MWPLASILHVFQLLMLNPAYLQYAGCFVSCWLLLMHHLKRPRMSYWMTIQLGVIILMQIFCNCWWSSLSLFLLMAFIIFKHIKLWASSEKMNWFDFLFVTLLLHMLPLFPVSIPILLQCCQMPCVVISCVLLHVLSVVDMASRLHLHYVNHCPKHTQTPYPLILSCLSNSWHGWMHCTMTCFWWYVMFTEGDHLGLLKTYSILCLPVLQLLVN